MDSRALYIVLPTKYFVSRAGDTPFFPGWCTHSYLITVAEGDRVKIILREKTWDRYCITAAYFAICCLVWFSNSAENLLLCFFFHYHYTTNVSVCRGRRRTDGVWWPNQRKRSLGLGRSVSAHLETIWHTISWSWQRLKHWVLAHITDYECTLWIRFDTDADECMSFYDFSMRMNIYGKTTQWMSTGNRVLLQFSIGEDAWRSPLPLRKETYKFWIEYETGIQNG